MVINYKASPTLHRLHQSRDLVRCVLGPIGSGKSVGSCMEILRLASTQAPDKEGVRRTRFAVIRNTIKELKDTTINTWLDWFSGLGEMHWSDLNFYMEFPLKDGTTVVSDLLFRGMDRPDQVKSLLSLELSGAFINEAKEVDPEIIQMTISRLGRYPARKDGVGCSFASLIMDSNFPSEDSFIYHMFEEERPEGWTLFKQPGGLDEGAENLENLPDTYYTSQMAGKSDNWLRVYRDAQYGFVMDGKAVWPEYNEKIHLIEEPWEPDPKREILLGLDFGRTPVAVFGQRDAFSRWVIFDELQGWNMGATRFGEMLYKKIITEYPNFKVKGWGDPAGDDMGQNDDRTPIQIINKAGVRIVPGRTQDTFIRIESVRVPLERLYDGEPAFRVTIGAPRLRKAMSGGYHYRRVQISGTARYDTKPNKNEYSHVADALQYLLSSAGEAVGLIKTSTKPEPISPKDAEWHVFD